MTLPIDAARPDLATVVLALDGVADIYPPQGALAQLPGLLTSMVTSTPGHKEIGVQVEDGHTAVTARIATHRSEPTPQTARRVADVILATIAEPDATVTIRVERIH